MLKPRLIPVLLLKNGILVRSRTFDFHQSTGDPIGQVERYTAWKADELIYLDISREGVHDYRQTMQVIGSTSSYKDLGATTSRDLSEVIYHVSKECMIPLTVGGGIHTLDDIALRLHNGADKVSINTKALEDLSFITRAADTFGRQCIVVSVDVRSDGEKHEVYKQFGKVNTGKDPIEWCKEVEASGAGEILLQSINRDGTAKGYDIPLIQSVVGATTVPIIALGGVGVFGHLVEGLQKGGASAVAAANIFHFTEQSIVNAKKYMQSKGIDVRL